MSERDTAAVMAVAGALFLLRLPAEEERDREREKSPRVLRGAWLRSAAAAFANAVEMRLALREENRTSVSSVGAGVYVSSAILAGLWEAAAGSLAGASGTGAGGAWPAAVVDRTNCLGCL